MKTRVLFVCLGNLCRSPTAEAIFREQAHRAGRADEFEIASAGTGPWHVGEPRDPRMTRAAAGRGYDLDGRGHQIAPDDFFDYDLVIAMDAQNETDLRAIAPDGQEDKIRRLREFDPTGDGDVPDPWYSSSASAFNDVVDIVERSTNGLLDSI